MSRADFSDIERTLSPRERVRYWFENLLSLAGLAIVGWFIGDSLIRLLAAGGWVPIATIVAGAIALFLWFWWSASSRRMKLFCIVLIVLAVGTPLG